MKKIVLIAVCLVLSFWGKAQIPVTDGANIAQSIVNSV